MQFACKPVDILYQDRHLVAIDKPPGSVVHRTRGADDALILWETLSAALGTKVFPLHRLDRQTSGVLLFALSAEMARMASVDVRDGRWQKSYLALCRGPIAAPLTIDHPVPERDCRRPAATDVVPLETFSQRLTLVQAVTTRGRRHQVRYHLKHANHPVVGDTTYGKGVINRYFRNEIGLSRLFLHASALTLPYPGRLNALTITAPLPADLTAALQKLRRIAHVPF